MSAPLCLTENTAHNKHKRQSWDTSIKHYSRLELDAQIPMALKNTIPSSNISRWKKEPEDKYKGCEVTQYIQQDLELIKRFNQSFRIKRIVTGYFKLCDTFHSIISTVKNIKILCNEHKTLIVNTIESIKEDIPINNALKVFNISRATFQYYKTIVIHKCDASYFKWCTKRIPNQLLPKEILTIKKYLTHEDYKYWSKSSIYLRAVRDTALCCGLTTFYKYSKLLGYTSRPNYDKRRFYNPLKTNKPNEVWCADVTIFRTLDGVNHYIHILMDHFSRMVLGFRIENVVLVPLLEIYYKKRTQNTISKR